ncbi:MAG: hypothetical protein KDB48_00370 [Solirubrobacterales bacterium]|nr:hypothetical protein [Solirubrobacterales bacterium]HMT04185.1 hypothetical protein [Solirubrobacterales bacterium]
MSQPLLIFLNEVAGGRKLLEAAREKAADASYVVVVAPQNQPSVGQLFAPEEKAEAARARVDVTLALLNEFGIDAIGEVLDPEYDLALGDAIRSHRPAEVLLSCTYDFRFGLTRRDLLEWAEITYGNVTTITHIPVRIEDDSISLNVTHTLVVANRTLPSDDLLGRLVERSEERPHRYTIIAPAYDGVSEATVARNLAGVIAKLYEADIDATGQPMSPDAFDAVKNAIEHYRVDEILISTLSGEESQWLQDDLVGRVREITDKPVVHHEAGRPPEAVAAVVAEGEVTETAEDSTVESNEA